MKSKVTARQYLGALLYDCPRAIRTAGGSQPLLGKIPWLNMRNRDELLLPNPNGVGVKCNWELTTDLYLPKIFPAYGRWLYRRILQDFPISLKLRPKPESIAMPQASFVIGHRGRQRLPLLLATLKSIAGQKDCRFECIVVEQDNESLIKEDLPDWVRYIHTPLPKKDMAYSRSWTFNVGAKAARADFLIFHDNDMLIPEVYASNLLHCYKQGYDFINLKRFIFYLDQSTSNTIVDSDDFRKKPEIEAIVQNLEAGGSFGASYQAYIDIGGFDEGFVGWGGEDNEFWERANTRKVYSYSYLPIIHLWHQPQPGKRAVQGNGLYTVDYLEERLKIAPEKRVKELCEVRLIHELEQ